MNRLLATVILMLLLPGCVGRDPAGSSPAPDDAPMPAAQQHDAALGTPPGATVQRVCIDADVGLVAPNPIRVIGRLMLPEQSSQTIFVAVPGGATSKDMFVQAATPEEVAAGHALQPFYAKRGVATLALDRPALGESQYTGANFLVEEYDALLAAVVAAVRTGSWATGEGCSAGPSFTKVVLGGESIGAMLSTHYVAYGAGPAVDGLALMGTFFMGFAPSVVAHAAYCAATTATSQRQHYFCDVPQPLATCEDILGAPTANQTFLAASCEELESTGDSISDSEVVRLVVTTGAGLGQLGTIPLHVVFWGEDHARSEPGDEQADEARQKQLVDTFCSCTPSYTTVPGVSHHFAVTPGQELGHEGIYQWMVAEGLAA